MSNIQVGTFTAAGQEQVANEVNALAGGVYFKIEVGQSILRVFPPEVGKESPFLITQMHFVDGIPGLPEGGTSFMCPRQAFREPCPMCAYVAELARSPNAADQAQSKDFAGKFRGFVNVLDRGTGLVKVLGFGILIWNQLKAIHGNPRAGGNYTDHTAKGRDIVITRTGTGKFDTKYLVQPDVTASPLAANDAEFAEIWESRHDLMQVVASVIPPEVLAWLGQPVPGVGGRPMRAITPGAQTSAPPPPRPPGAIGSRFARPPGVQPAGTAINAAAATHQPVIDVPVIVEPRYDDNGDLIPF